MTSTAAQATRTNYRDAGAPTAGLWFGRKSKAEGTGVEVTLHREARAIRVVDTATGETLEHFGDTGKFWFAPILEAAPADPAEMDAAAAANVAARLERYSEPSISLRHSTTSVMQTTAAQGGDRDLAAAYGRLLEQIEPAYQAAQAENAADTIRVRAHVAAQRAAGWDGRPLRTPDADAIHAAQAAGVPADRIRAAYAAAPSANGERMPNPWSDEPMPPATPAVLEAIAGDDDITPDPVVIIPCGAKKAPGRVRAAAKYTGPYARSARLAGEAVAARTGARIITLSARFGLLEDDDLVDDYDLKMGDPGSVTAATIAAQAARLGITDALVTVIAGKAYADVVTTVWPHAVRVLDGCTSYGNQRARMGEIARGTWSPALPAGATAAPALFGADLVAPPARTPVDAADLTRGDVLAAGSFGLKGADPVLIVGSATAADVVNGAQRVAVAYRIGPGRTLHGVLYADSVLELVGHETMPDRPELPLPPAAEADVVVEGPAVTPLPHEIRDLYVSLPAGCSLPAYGPLPANTVVVLARSEFWDSQYRETPNLTMHIVTWGLPTVALCRATLVATEGREAYAGRDGATYYRHTGRPDLAGRDDARFGYPGESTCQTCRNTFDQQTREGLPGEILEPMKEERRQVRAAQRAAAQERRDQGARAAAAYRAERDAVEALEAVEPVDLGALVDRLDLVDVDQAPAALEAPAGELATDPADTRQRDLFGNLVDPGELAAAGWPGPARVDQGPPAPVARGPDVRSPRERPDLHTFALFPAPHRERPS